MFGKPNGWDRVAQALVAAPAVVSLGNGMLMLAAPLGWYQNLEGAQATGAFNSHFVMDIGIAYLASGLMLLYAALWPAGRWLAIVAGAAWLTGHAVLHIIEYVAGHAHGAIFWADAPGVVGPPLLAWAGLALLLARRRIVPAGLPRWIFRRAAAAEAPGEAAVTDAVAALPGRALEKYLMLLPLTAHRHEAPADLFHLARLGAVLAEDCGTCATTAAHQAVADGVPRELVRQALAGGGDLQGGQARAFRFGAALAERSVEAVELGGEVAANHGEAVRAELALAAAAVRTFPGLKRGLGLAQSCALAPPSI